MADRGGGRGGVWMQWRRRLVAAGEGDGGRGGGCRRPIGPTYVVGPWTHEYRKKKRRRFLITEKNISFRMKTTLI